MTAILFAVVTGTVVLAIVADLAGVAAWIGGIVARRREGAR